jgi:hypothetical protein
MPKKTLKKAPKITTKVSGVNAYDVYADGELVAYFHFVRCKGPYHVVCTGFFRNLNSGRDMDLGHMAYFRDVVQNIPSFLEWTA